MFFFWHHFWHRVFAGGVGAKKTIQKFFSFRDVRLLFLKLIRGCLWCWKYDAFHVDVAATCVVFHHDIWDSTGNHHPWSIILDRMPPRRGTHRHPKWQSQGRRHPKVWRKWWWKRCKHQRKKKSLGHGRVGYFSFRLLLRSIFKYLCNIISASIYLYIHMFFFLFLFKKLCIWCLWCLKPSFFFHESRLFLYPFLFSVSDAIHQVDLEGEMELFRHLKVPAVLPSSTNLEASVKGETSTSRSESYADMEIVSTASDEGMEFLLLSDEDEVEVEPPPPEKIKVASTAPERKRKAATLEPYTSTYEVAVGDTVKIIKAAGGTFAIFSGFTWKDWRFNKRGDAGRYVWGPKVLTLTIVWMIITAVARGKASQLVLGRHLTSTLKLKKWMNISNLQTIPNPLNPKHQNGRLIEHARQGQAFLKHSF